MYVTEDRRIAWTNHGECLDLTDGKSAPGTDVSGQSFLRVP
jgi:hypothetical protein